MPVYKYKSFEEAEKALWSNKVDSSYLNELKEFYELKIRLTRSFNITQGISKFNTLEDANKAKLEEILLNSINH